MNVFIQCFGSLTNVHPLVPVLVLLFIKRDKNSTGSFCFFHGDLWRAVPLEIERRRGTTRTSSKRSYWCDMQLMSRLKVQLKTAVHCQKNKRINPQEADSLGTSSLCLGKNLKSSPVDISLQHVFEKKKKNRGETRNKNTTVQSALTND